MLITTNLNKNLEKFEKNHIESSNSKTWQVHGKNKKRQKRYNLFFSVPIMSSFSFSSIPRFHSVQFLCRYLVVALLHFPCYALFAQVPRIKKTNNSACMKMYEQKKPQRPLRRNITSTPPPFMHNTCFSCRRAAWIQRGCVTLAPDPPASNEVASPAGAPLPRRGQ